LPSTKCPDCRARVRKTETRCQTCGTVNWKNLGRAPLWRASRWAGALGGGALGAWLGLSVLAPLGTFLAFGLAGVVTVSGLLAMFRRQEGGCLIGGAGFASLIAVLAIPASAWPVGAAVLAGSLLAWLGSKGLRGLLGKLLLPKGGRTLKQTRTLIARRLRELRQRLRRMRDLQRQVPGTPAGELTGAAREALVEGEVKLHEQAARYRAQDWRIDYARWRNEVVALSEDADERAVDAKSIGELKLLDNAGRRLLEEIRRDAEALGTDEGSDGAERLEETMGALETLRQRVMLLVAVSESAGLPNADATAFDATAADPRFFEALNVEVDEAELFADLSRLEAEHQELSTELDTQAGGKRRRTRD